MMQASSINDAGIKKILITQETSVNSQALFEQISKRFNVEFLYHSFLRTESLSVEDFKKQGINVNKYTAIVFFNRASVDHFFHLMKQMDVELSATTRYFCPNENLALYLGKYMTIRKRKLHYSKNRSLEELLKLINKYKKETFLYIGRPKARHPVLTYFRSHKYKYKCVRVYDIVLNPFKDTEKLAEVDLICFSAPAAIEAFLSSTPKHFHNKKIGIYGVETRRLAQKKKLNIVFEGPTEEHRSLYQLIRHYLLNQSN